MRRPLFAAGFMAALLAAGLACAAGNVLLPPSGGDNNTMPNLGLGASSAPAPSTASASLIPQAAAPEPAAAPEITPPVPAPALAQTPASSPLTDAQTRQIQTNLATIITPVDAASAARLPPGTLPTQIIRSPDMSAMIAMADRNLPYALTLAIGGNSVFGAKDVQELTARLGLTRDQIPSSCILTVRGLIQTDKGGYLLAGNVSPQASARYDGMITNLLLNAEALCTAAKLPPGAGFIEQVGDRYNIPLQIIQCPPPNRQATQLTIGYDGSDKAQCAYQ